jgi:hypothetical protein
MRTSVCLLVSCAVACHSSSPSHDQQTPDAPNTVGDASGQTDGSGSSASGLGALMPQETAGDPSAVMTTPNVVAITYDNDPSRSDIEAFYPQYAASSAWALQTAEYGIGPLTVGTPLHLSGTPPTSDSALQKVISANLTGSSPAWGAPSESTLYSVTLPINSKFTDDMGQSCCGGYHDDFMVGSVDVAYSVQCPCTNNSFPPPVTALQALTFALSHELVEAATDPRYEHDYAWGDLDVAHEVWAYITDGELADLCEFTDTVLWNDAPNMTYTISRIWSNAAARAGTDPCLGAPTTPYYQSVPEQLDDAVIELFGTSTVTKATKVAVGATGMITLHVAGTAGAGPFKVSAVDVASLYFGAKAVLTFTQPTGTFALGDTVSIPVTVVAKDPNLGGSGAEAFEIDTQPTGGGPTTYFYGLITQ